jgi:hypothetical protein
MRPNKKPLSLNREIIRQLTTPDLSSVAGAINVRTYNCPTIGCPTQRNSCFNSCYDSDCCLEVP